MKRILFALTLGCAAAPTFSDEGLSKGWEYASLGYSHHSTTFAPKWEGHKDSYTGTSSLWPTLAIQGFGDAVYGKADFEGMIAYACNLVEFGGIRYGDDLDTLPDHHTKSYAVEFHGYGWFPRIELGINLPTPFGSFGLGLNLDPIQIGISDNKDKFESYPDRVLDVGPQIQYSIMLGDRLALNPSFTYNFHVQDASLQSVSGSGFHLEALATLKLAARFGLLGQIGYDVHNLEMKAPGVMKGDHAQFRDLAFRFSVGYIPLD